MTRTIKVNGTEYAAKITELHHDNNWGGRSAMMLNLTMSAAEAAALLPAGAEWSIVLRDTVPVYDGDGLPTGSQEAVTETDMREYCLAGQITDHRDGTVSIKMGKPTETENAVGAVVALMGEVVTVARSAELRPMIEQASASLSDGEAAKSPELFPRWADPVSYIEGNRVSDGGKLYKCRKAHTSQEGWNPSATPALWVVIDVSHAGTQADPIPAARGMEYEYGKYYLDGEDGNTYLCQRTGEAAGGTIVLQYLPHELVGQYFDLAN